MAAAFFSSAVTKTPVSASMDFAREEALSSTGRVIRVNTVDSAYRQIPRKTTMFPTSARAESQVSRTPTITSGKASMVPMLVTGTRNARSR